MHTNRPFGAIGPPRPWAKARRVQCLEITRDLTNVMATARGAAVTFAMALASERSLTHKVMHSLCVLFCDTFMNEGLKRKCSGEPLGLRTLQLRDKAI